MEFLAATTSIVESLQAPEIHTSSSFQDTASLPTFAVISAAVGGGDDPSTNDSTDDDDDGGGGGGGGGDEAAALEEAAPKTTTTTTTTTRPKRTKSSTFERFRATVLRARGNKGPPFGVAGAGAAAPRLVSTLAMITEQDRLAFSDYTDDRLEHLKTVLWVPAAATLVVVGIFAVPIRGDVYGQTVWANPLFAFVHWPLCIAFSMPLSAYIFKSITGHEALTSRWVLFRGSMAGACVPPVVFALFQEVGGVFPVPFSTIVVNVPVGIFTMVCLFFSLPRDMRTKRLLRQTQLATDICGMVTVCAILYMAHFKVMASFDIKGFRLSDISRGAWPPWQEVCLPWLRPV